MNRPSVSTSQIAPARASPRFRYLRPPALLMHHLRFAQPQAMGARVSDEFTVPLCRTHHREVHRIGDEQGWWARCGVDALTMPPPCESRDQYRTPNYHDRCWY